MWRLLFILALWSCNPPVDQPCHYAETLPAFERFNNIKEQKKAFFNFLLPIIQQQNSAIHRERLRLTKLTTPTSDPGDSTWLYNLAATYKLIDTDGMIEKILMHHDTLPPSLVLAQAAMESSWGTSRFATEGNNLFGEWCFRPGCGIVPKKRSTADRHEVRKFPSINASIAGYYRNINSHRAYRTLRKMRREAHRKNQSPTGIMLAGGLTRYSQRGDEYVREIRQIIRYNALE